MDQHDEVLFEAARPAILNGINDIITRPDLADRSLFVTLEVISDQKRREDSELLAAFEAKRARILGVLLDALATGLKQLPATCLPEKPRMADFAIWATACETAFWPAGTFMAAYIDNLREVVDTVIDADAVGSAVRQMATKLSKEWTGTATELLRALGALQPESATRAKNWPGSPDALSNQLRRSMTFLRKAGVNVSFSREGVERTRTIHIAAASPKIGGSRASKVSVVSISNDIKDLDADTLTDTMKAEVSADAAEGLADVGPGASVRQSVRSHVVDIADEKAATDTMDTLDASPPLLRGRKKHALRRHAVPTRRTWAKTARELSAMLDAVTAPASTAPAFGTTAAGMTFYEFFAGAGMVRLGLGPDWTCLLANDNDVDKAMSYARNFTVHALKIDDVACLPRTSPAAQISLGAASPARTSPLPARAGLEGERSATFWDFWGLMMALRAEGRAPRLVVIENVCGLITGHGGKDFVALCDAFTEGGYRIGAMVIDAALFVPQSRPRVFIIGVDATLPIPAEIVVDQPDLTFHDDAVVKALSRQKAAPIWFKLPIPPPHGLTLCDIIDDQAREWDTSSAVAELIGKMEKPHLDRLDEDKRAGGLVIRSLNYRTRNGIPQWESRDDLIANCLRTGSGGSNVQRLMFVDGPSVRTRKISPLEYARAMGLPKSTSCPQPSARPTI